MDGQIRRRHSDSGKRTARLPDRRRDRRPRSSRLSDFAGLQAALSEGKTDDLIFFAFDLLFLEGEDLRSRPLSTGSSALKDLIEEVYGKDQAEIRYVEHFESGGDAVLKSACRMSLEGIVSKQAGARYASGRSG